MTIFFVTRGTFSSNEHSLLLLGNEDKMVLENVISNYIDLLDDEIIPMSSYNYLEILSLNYDF